MSESGVFRSWKYHVADTQLADTAQTLDFRTANQFENKSARYRDESVNRIGEQFESAVHVKGSSCEQDGRRIEAQKGSFEPYTSMTGLGSDRFPRESVRLTGNIPQERLFVDCWKRATAHYRPHQGPHDLTRATFLRTSGCPRSLSGIGAIRDKNAAVTLAVGCNLERRRVCRRF